MGSTAAEEFAKDVTKASVELKEFGRNLEVYEQ
jgi:hypothetical protein